jgi:hypothetical protein
LIAYWLIAASFVVLAYVATFVGVVVRSVAACEVEQKRFISLFNDDGYLASRRAAVIVAYGSIEAAAEAEFPSGYLAHARALIGSPGMPLTYVLPAVPLLAWPWLTFIPLLIFRWSMSRARVGMVHVLRCILHSSDLLIWYGLLLVGLTPLLAQAQGPARYWGPKPTMLKGASSGWGILSLGIPIAEIVGISIAVVFVSVAIYRLSVAYRRYLRFDHSVATVLASQLIVALAILNAVLAYRVWL